MSIGEEKVGDMKCSAYRCTEDAVAEKLTEIYGDGRRVWLYWCEEHRRPTDWPLPDPDRVALTRQQASMGTGSTIDEILENLE